MKRKTIRSHKDFFTPRENPGIGGNLFVIKIKPAKIPNDARYGLIVSKRIFKLAVQRNRVKRMMRDWIYVNEDLMMPDFDYIFILREPVLGVKRDDGRREMQIKLKKLAKNYHNNVNK